MGKRIQLRRPRKPKLALVGRNPQLVKEGVELTDGDDIYKVHEMGRRMNDTWAQLYNVNFPERKEWFRLADLNELAVIL